MTDYRKRICLAACIISMCVVLSCGGKSGGDDGKNSGESRSFYMGFSPWPYDNTQSAVDWVYSSIRNDGDIISQHIEEGVPWPEAYSSAAFDASFVNSNNSRVEKSEGKRIVLQISPLNGARDGMALYRGSSINAPLPADWQGLELDDAKVKAAFLNYAERMISAFNPDYLIIGVEVNLLIRKNPSKWSNYLALHRYVYAEIKKSHPSLPVGVSLFCVPFFPEWSSEDNRAAQLSGLADLESDVDFIAFSFHPFMSALLADDFPEDYIHQLFSLSNKPVAISESSYPAQEWTTMSAPILTFKGTPAKQERFLSLMLNQCAESKALFAIWFSIRDYDALWNGFDAATQSSSIVWRDTGLYDKSGAGRQALAVWREWLAKEVSR